MNIPRTDICVGAVLLHSYFRFTTSGLCGSAYNLFILRGSQAKFERTTWFYLRALSVTDILYLLFMIGYLVSSNWSDIWFDEYFDVNPHLHVTAECRQLCNKALHRWTTSCCRPLSGLTRVSLVTSHTGMSSSPTPSSRPPRESSCSPPSTSTNTFTIRTFPFPPNLIPSSTSCSPSSPASFSSCRGSWSSPSWSTAMG